MKKTSIAIIVIIIIVLVAVAAFFYLTRPIAPPTESVETAAVGNQIAATAGASVYRLSSASSTVAFTITEVLYGKPNTVVGTTSAIAGDVSVSHDASGAPVIVIGTTTIDARTFVTDNAQRNGAIGRFILKSDQPGNEYITFAPTSVTGLPAAIVPGQPFGFSVTGDLTVSGVTKPATFAVMATENADSLTGTATVALSRSDFGLVIPNIPFVAGVPDAFTVAVSFVADKVQ